MLQPAATMVFTWSCRLQVRSLFEQWAATNCAMPRNASAGQYATSNCKLLLFMLRLINIVLLYTMPWLNINNLRTWHSYWTIFILQCSFYCFLLIDFRRFICLFFHHLFTLDAPRLDWLAFGQPATALLAGLRPAARRLAPAVAAAAACPALQPAEWIVPA